MSQNVVLHVGPARSGKTHQLLEQYRAALLASGPAIGRTLWIAPTTRSAAAVREQLVASGLAGCLAPGIVTFDQLTDNILAQTTLRLWPVASSAQRDLLRRAVQKALGNGRFVTFAPTALSSGFVDLLVEHVRELKRRGIEPHAFDNSPSRRPNSDEHLELGQLYADYQLLLAEHALADREGRHWLARDQLAAGVCSSLARLSLIVVDGFTDFTPTQQDVLSLLSADCDELHVSLPGEIAQTGNLRAGHLKDQQPARPDLFAKTNATLAELRRHHPQLLIRGHAPRPTGWPALDHLAEHIFRNPRQVPPPPAEVVQSLDRLEIIAAAGQQGEIIEIARRIKQRLVTGVARPGEIVVVFRTLHQAASRVREVFTEFGIPFALESTERLIHSPVLKALLGLLRLAEEDWPFRRVIATITNKSLTTLGDDARLAADWLVRDLQIAGDRNKLLTRAAQLADAAAPPDQLSEHRQRRAAAAQAALPALRQIAGALDELPKTGTLVEWCDALALLGARVGLSPFHDSNAPVVTNDFSETLNDEDSLAAEGDDGARPDSSDDVLHDRAAWQAVSRQFTAIAQLDARLGDPPRELSRADVLRSLVDIASHEPLSAPHDEVGRVRVLSAPSARTVSAKHLYLAGMSEQAFPSPEPAGRLYGEADYRAFQFEADKHKCEPLAKSKTGPRRSPTPPLAPPTLSRSQEEMLLFYEVLTRAEESLTISYPALDDKAQALPPSPYVTEIERLLGDEQFNRRCSAPQLLPLPPSGSPLCPADWRLQAVDHALGGDVAQLAGLLTAPAALSVPGAAIDAGLRLVHLRGRREFGPADGLFSNPAAAARLARRFGPQHLWSPTQWEQYAACPYKFFLSDVLDLEPLGELTLETDYRRRGSMLHQVLATFYRAAPANLDQQQFLTRLLEVLAAEVDATARSGVDAALVELDRRQIAKWAEKHFDHLSEYLSAAAGFDAPLTPTHFELRFGPARPGDAGGDDARSTNDAFQLDLGGEKVRVTGRIDRVDVGQQGGQTVFSVIDYKTGHAPSLKEEHIASGERLQLPIYVAAAQSLFFNNNATPVAAGYWTMDRGFDKRGALNVLQDPAGKRGGPEKFDELQKQVIEQVSTFVAGIRGGDFPVHSRDEHCTGRCEFSTVCRVAQIRSLGKTWPQE